MEEPPENVDQSLPDGTPPLLLRRQVYKRDEPATHPSDQLGNVIAYLGTLHAQLKENEQRADADAAPEPGRKILQEKRLTRSGVPLDGIFAPLDPANGTDLDPAAESEPGILPASGWMDVPANLAGFVTLPLTPAPVRGRPGAFAPASPADSAPVRRWSRWLLPLGVGVLSAALAVAACFVWGIRSPGGYARAPHSSNQAADSDDYPPDETVSDDALAAADQTLDAISRGDLPGASALLADAHRRNLGLPGLSYQAALLALNQGNEDQLNFWTDRSLAAHESVSECWYLLAFRQNALGHFHEAMDDLASAARFAPFSPRYAFFWGEYLRRTGNPALALPHFQQALRCRPALLDAGLILFKQRLARVEEGHDATFQADLAEHLAREPVSGDTWLLGAASAINRAAYPAAAEDLRRAARVLPPTVLRNRVRDYLFLSQANQPDLAPFFASLAAAPAPGSPPPKAGKSPFLVDPATRGLADADPAGW